MKRAERLKFHRYLLLLLAVSSLSALGFAAKPATSADPGSGQIKFFLARQAADPGPVPYSPVSADLGFSLTVPGDWNLYEETADSDAIHLTPETLKNHQSRYKSGISIFRLAPQSKPDNDLSLTFKEIDIRIQGLISNGFLPTDAGIISDTVQGYWIEYRLKDFRFIGTFISANDSALWVVLKSDKKKFESKRIVYENVLSKLEPI